MTSDTPDIRQLVARVEGLERQNRRLRCFALAGLALIGGLALIAGANPSQAQLGQPGPISTDCVILKDEKGMWRGTLGAGSPGPGLYLADESGKARATYKEDGIVLRDAKGNVRAVLAVAKDGAKLELLGEKGKVVSRLGN